MISDHLNLMGAKSARGEAQKGEIRFPDMTDAYNPACAGCCGRRRKKLGSRYGKECTQDCGSVVRNAERSKDAETTRRRCGWNVDGAGGNSGQGAGNALSGSQLIPNAAAGVTGAPSSCRSAGNHESRQRTFESLVTEFLVRSAAPNYPR